MNHGEEQKTAETYLESSDGSALETEIGLEVLSDLTNETLEGQLADQKLRRLLVTTDLTEGNGTGTITMGLLDSTSGWSGLPGGLGGQLLPRGLASGGLTSGLLGTSHFVKRCQRFFEISSICLFTMIGLDQVEGREQ